MMFDFLALFRRSRIKKLYKTECVQNGYSRHTVTGQDVFREARADILVQDRMCSELSGQIY